MLKYIGKRLLLMIPVIIGVSFFIFVAMNLAQGDYVDTLVLENMTEEQVEALRAKYNLDKGILEQYLIYMWNFVRGDLGISWTSNIPVMEMYLTRLPATAYLAFSTCFIGTVFSIPLGIVAARRRGSLVDTGATLFCLLGVSAPSFWMGMMLMILFSLKLGWLPSGGNEVWYAVLMPAFTLGIARMANLCRTTRSSMLDTLSADYLRTARAKGVPEREVVNKHALKPAFIPILNIAMSQISHALGGAALTEAVFTWPGVGRMIVDSVQARDIPLACGSLIMTCIIIGLFELLTDLLYVLVDPRLRTHYAAAAVSKGRRKANG